MTRVGANWFMAKLLERRDAMTRLTNYTMYDDIYEYFGGTTIQRTRTKADQTVWRDWLLFDSIEAAFEFFNEYCSA